jgi:hypothetical protein
MKPENKETRLFLLDLDITDTQEIELFVAQNAIDVKLKYPTKKGYHYITKPFNVKLAEQLTSVTIQKDGLLLINTLDRE